MEDGETVERVQVYCEFAVGGETMRSLLRREVEAENVAAVARRLRVNPRTLRSFLAGGEPSRALWDGGAELARDRPPPQIQAGAVALNLLADAYPPGERVEVRKMMARALVAACEAGEIDVPAGLREAAAGR